MEKYNYLEAVKEDVESYIKCNIDMSIFNNVNELSEFLENELLFNTDDVTGNPSGSYTFSRRQAEEYLCYNVDLLCEALQVLEIEIDKGAEMCDVAIRCYLLPEAIEAVLETYEIEGVPLEVYFKNKNK